MVPVRSAVSNPEFPAAYSVTARSIVRMNGDMHAAAVTPATAERATSTVLGTASSTSRGRAGAAGPPPPMSCCPCSCRAVRGLVQSSGLPALTSMESPTSH